VEATKASDMGLDTEDRKAARRSSRSVFQTTNDDHGFRKGLLEFLLILFLAILNPFGMTDSLAGLSRDVMMRATAGYYDLNRDPHSAVVLIDDVSISGTMRGTINDPATNNLSPPPPSQSSAISRHYIAEVLTSLVRHGAEAVFLDFLFIDDAVGTTALVEAIVEAKDLGVSVYVASSVGEGRANCDELVFARIAAVASGVSRILRTDHDWHEYHPSPKPCASKTADTKTVGIDAASPALTLYRDYCKSRPTKCDKSENIDDDRIWIREMIPRWGATAPDIITKLREYQGKKICKSSDISDWISAARYFISSLYGDFRETYAKSKKENLPKHPCFPSPTVFSWELLINEHNPDRVVQEAIYGKWVFVGNSVIGLNDFSVSPIFKIVPGVLMHAVAFDNIVSYHNNYVKAWAEIFGDPDENEELKSKSYKEFQDFFKNLEWDDLVEASCALIIFVSIRLMSSVWRRVDFEIYWIGVYYGFGIYWAWPLVGFGYQLISVFTQWLLFVIVIILFCVFLFIYGRFDPVNLIGLLALAGIALDTPNRVKLTFLGVVIATLSIVKMGELA